MFVKEFEIDFVIIINVKKIYVWVDVFIKVIGIVVSCSFVYIYGFLVLDNWIVYLFINNIGCFIDLFFFFWNSVCNIRLLLKILDDFYVNKYC